MVPLLSGAVAEDVALGGGCHGVAALLDWNGNLGTTQCWRCHR